MCVMTAMRKNNISVKKYHVLSVGMKNELD